MNRDTLIVMLWGLWLASPAPASAHRLDEYLQATRITVGLDMVCVDIDLTAGVAVASNVFGFIDSDGDGRLSPAEREAYARLVVASAVLEVDGSRTPLILVDSQFPSFGDMSAGLGTIRLKARANVPAEPPGRHRLSYLNVHRPGMSAYLVNALVPAAKEIQITDQRRDMWQHGLRIDYTVACSGCALRARIWQGIGGLALVTILIWLRRRPQLPHQPREVDLAPRFTQRASGHL
jgi:hypothetical protein